MLMRSECPAQRLRRYACAVQELRSQACAGYSAIKRFQSRRLQQTYQDLLASQRYRPAAQFFLSDLYGEKDFSRRDSELQRVIPALQRFLPDTALATIADAVELDALSEKLDRLMAKLWSEQTSALGAEATQEGAEDLPTLTSYRKAYQAAAKQSPGERELQIQLVRTIGSSLNGLVRKPLLGGLLKTMGPVAQAAGLSSMHEFLLRGFQAFKHMGDAEEFLQTIHSRESAIHEAMNSRLDEAMLQRVTGVMPSAARA